MYLTLKKLGEAYVSYSLIKKLFYEKRRNDVTFTWSRGSSISDFMINKTIYTHNGLFFSPVYVSKSFVFFNDFNIIKDFHKIGEFCFTKHLDTRDDYRAEKKIKK